MPKKKGEKERKETQQTILGIFLKRATSPQRVSGRPFGGAPEEGSIVTGDDSCMRVIAPETFQWDRMWVWGQWY